MADENSESFVPYFDTDEFDIVDGDEASSSTEETLVSLKQSDIQSARLPDSPDAKPDKSQPRRGKSEKDFVPSFDDTGKYPAMDKLISGIFGKRGRGRKQDAPEPGVEEDLADEVVRPLEQLDVPTRPVSSGLTAEDLTPTGKLWDSTPAPGSLMAEDLKPTGKLWDPTPVEQLPEELKRTGKLGASQSAVEEAPPISFDALRDEIDAAELFPWLQEEEPEEATPAVPTPPVLPAPAPPAPQSEEPDEPPASVEKDGADGVVVRVYFPHKDALPPSKGKPEEAAVPKSDASPDFDFLSTLAAPAPPAPPDFDFLSTPAEPIPAETPDFDFLRPASDPAPAKPPESALPDISTLFDIPDAMDASDIEPVEQGDMLPGWLEAAISEPLSAFEEQPVESTLLGDMEEIGAEAAAKEEPLPLFDFDPADEQTDEDDWMSELRLVDSPSLEQEGKKKRKKKTRQKKEKDPKEKKARKPLPVLPIFVLAAIITIVVIVAVLVLSGRLNISLPFVGNILPQSEEPEAQPLVEATETPYLPATSTPMGGLPTATPIAPTQTAIPTEVMAPTEAPPSDIIPTDEGILQLGVAMVLVPGDSFQMGDGSGAHLVTLSEYYIDQYEVTNSQWADCVADGGCTLPASTNDYLEQPYYGVEEFLDYPVINVSWEQAAAYCEWRGARLPTEAEWEMAARWDPESGAVTTYPWGDAWDPFRLNYCDAGCVLSSANPSYNDSWPQLAPVGSFPSGASPVGAYDMSGNVSEWVSDWYDAGYYAVSPVEDPPGPETGTQRVIRGGAWGIGNPDALRSSSRFQAAPDAFGVGTGLRCVLPASEVEIKSGT